MTTRILRNEQDCRELFRLIEGRKLPMTVTVLKGAKRTTEQNRLQRLWMEEAAEQRQDDTAEDYRAYCKLHIGVPILRAENPDFREKYDRIIRPLTYQEKLELMKVPFDFPVTRLMTSEQKARYLDLVYIHLTGLGVNLTEPKEKRCPPTSKTR